jgi:hypothetical protein
MVAVHGLLIMLAASLVLTGCQRGDLTDDRNCANDPVEVERSQRTPLGFSADEALRAATRSWATLATLFDHRRQPTGDTPLQVDVAPGEGPARYQDPEVFQNARYDRPRTCPEAVHVPITLTITSADGRIALAETAEIPVHRLDEVTVVQQWLLPSSPDPGLVRYPPLKGRVDVPPAFTEGDGATSLNLTIDIDSGSGDLWLMSFRRLPDALSAGAAKLLARW